MPDIKERQDSCNLKPVQGWSILLLLCTSRFKILGNVGLMKGKKGREVKCIPIVLVFLGCVGVKISR